MDTIREMREKYLSCVEFHNLVEVLSRFMIDARLTPQDIRDAAFMAGIKIHEQMAVSAWNQTFQEKKKGS